MHYNPHLISESLNFPRFIGNLGFCSPDALCMHYRQTTYEVTLISSDHHYKNSFCHCELGYGTDTAFHRTSFITDYKINIRVYTIRVPPVFFLSILGF